MDKKNRALVDALRKWLCDDGLEFFREVKEKYGKVNTLLDTSDAPDGEMMTLPNGGSVSIPHPVHFREGMHVRNFMRRSGLCEGWSDHDLDNRWAELVEQAIL